MDIEDKFNFRRARGVVWVCDIEGSTEHLNNKHTVDLIEKYLPRLHWLAMAFTKAAGGEFIKWTGDGFLSWFEMPLHRDLESNVATVLNAIWHLTVFNNVTGLGVPLKVRVRHGVAYEKDALVSIINYPNGYKAMDLMGRDVVLAFRFAGVPAPFPGITTNGEIVNARPSSLPISFQFWKPAEEDILRYFKGQTWGTNALFQACEYERKPANNLRDAIETARMASEKSTEEKPIDETFFRFALRFQHELQAGPFWAADALGEYIKFIKDELLANINQIIKLYEDDELEGYGKS